MGDFRDDGTLRYVEYRYRAATSSTTACTTPPCALWRSDSCVPGTATGCTITTQNAAVMVADNLMNTVATAGVFNYFLLCRTGTLPQSRARLCHVSEHLVRYSGESLVLLWPTFTCWELR